MPSDEMVEKALAAWRSFATKTMPDWHTHAMRAAIAAALSAAHAEPVAEPGEDVIAAILHLRGPLWWEQELARHWGDGHSSHDTRRAARVACNLIKQVRASPSEAAIRADERAAIRKEAFEEAAKVAEDAGTPYFLNTNTGAMMFRAVTAKIATAIRARGET